MPQITPPVAEPNKGLTQHQKIIAMMCKNHTKEWWLPTDFMKFEAGEFFVGYEASARLSELQNNYPYIFETRQAGRFKERRLRFDTGKDWYNDAPQWMQVVIKRYYKGGQK